MQLVDKKFDYRQKSEGGFVLIAALMAVMILMAVGFLALTVTSQDILISSRLVGERKALSAAEAGAQQLCVSLNIAAPSAMILLPATLLLSLFEIPICRQWLQPAVETSVRALQEAFMTRLLPVATPVTTHR